MSVSRIVQSASQLPRLAGARDVFLDLETTSGSDDADSLNPWHDCRPCGLAITVDEVPDAWYVPLDHRGEAGVDRGAVVVWLREILDAAETWSNHNVKYDAHVLKNSLGIEFRGVLWDSLVWAKLFDTDRQNRGGYGLDVLSRDWLGEDISRHYELLVKYLRLGGTDKRPRMSKDYGLVPSRVMAPYACQDVLTNRRLKRYLTQLMPESMAGVCAMETELTRVLFEMEQLGMRVDPAQLRQSELACILRLFQLDEELAQLVGRSFNPNSSDQLFDVVCNQYGLPVLGWTEEDDDGEPAGNPSFDKEALAHYLVHPLSPPGLFPRIIEYKKRSTFRSLFLETYQELADDTNHLHAIYNQLVRTGRMSASKPNAQQLDADAKELILPEEGCAFLAQDQSQIEFRVIGHFIRDPHIIKTYNEDPDTDFHNWMSEMAAIARRPAKTMNFLMGYGGGKKKAVRTLSMDKDVVGRLLEEVDVMIRDGRATADQRNHYFEQKAKIAAEGVYSRYHRALPTLKPTSRRAADVCRERGYVFDPTGRRRHLPATHAHKAFNTLCQGYAAGIQKLTTVMAARALRDTPITMRANVHDETLFHGPIEVMRRRETQVALSWLLEHPPLPEGAMSIPLRVATGYSERHWREASKGIYTLADDGKTKIWATPEPEPIKYTDEERRRLSSTPIEELLEFLR